MSTPKTLLKIVNDPVEQLLVSLSLILYLLYLNSGYTVLLVCTLVLDALFLARIVQIALGKDRPISAGTVKVLSFLDYGLFFLTIYMLFNSKMSSGSTVGQVFVIVACAILVILTIVSLINPSKKKRS